MPGDKGCVITVDEKAFRNVPKVILPDDEVLDSNHDDIDEYIKTLDKTWDPEKTVRISHIPKYGLGGDILQMVIPPPLLNSRGGGLDIKAQCKDDAGARGPTADYGQWDNAKGAKLTRLSDTDKIQTLADMVKKANEYMDSVRALNHIDFLELRATNALYTAREGAAELAQFVQECQGAGDLKKGCKDLLKHYIEIREEYARFFNTAATKAVDMLTKSLEKKNDAVAKSKGVQELKDWLARLQENLDTKVKELEAIKKGDSAVLPQGNSLFFSIEKQALQRELGVIKKGLKKTVNDATALVAKYAPENTSLGSKDSSAIQGFKDWLRKTWDKVLPSKDGGSDDDGQSSDTAAEDPGTSITDNDKPPPKNRLKPDPNRPPPKNQLKPDLDKPPPKNTLKPSTKPASADGAGSEGKNDNDDESTGSPRKRPKKPNQ